MEKKKIQNIFNVKRISLKYFCRYFMKLQKIKIFIETKKTRENFQKQNFLFLNLKHICQTCKLQNDLQYINTVWKKWITEELTLLKNNIAGNNDCKTICSTTIGSKTDSAIKISCCRHPSRESIHLFCYAFPFHYFVI